MTFSLAQGFTFAQNFTLKLGSTNTVENKENTLKGCCPFGPSIEIPIDPQDIYDGTIPFNNLVLKPQTAAFGIPGGTLVLKTLVFSNLDVSKVVAVVFTNEGVGAFVPIDPTDDGPGMWVLVLDASDDPPRIEAFRITDGTNILIPEVHLAELTGIFGDLIFAEGDSTMLPNSEIWSECFPFARFAYSPVLALPLTIYDALQPQLTAELPEGALVAIFQSCP